LGFWTRRRTDGGSRNPNLRRVSSEPPLMAKKKMFGLGTRQVVRPWEGKWSPKA